MSQVFLTFGEVLILSVCVNSQADAGGRERPTDLGGKFHHFGPETI